MTLNPKWEGGALYYVIFTSVIFSLLSACLLTLVQLLHLENTKVERKRTVQHNLQSGITWMLSEEPPCALNDSLASDLFGEGTDSLAMQRAPWGLFEVVTVNSFIRDEHLHRTFFVGKALIPEERTALFLEDHNRPLSLCGKTLVEGTCYLPKAGVKRAYIEGKTFAGEKLIQGETKTSENQLPKLINTLELTELFALLVPQEDSNDQTTEMPSSFDRSFETNPQWIRIGTQTLTAVDWKGHFIAFSQDYLYIDSSCHLEDIIVIAPAIRLEEGFEGTGQFLATDSIVLEDNVHLTYPSALLLKKSHPSGNAEIIIGSGATVEGLVAMIVEHTLPNAQNLVRLEKDAVVNGFVYAESAIDHKGTVNGMLYAQRFLLSTPSSVYENHLLDATVSSRQLHARFVFPMNSLMEGDRALMKWVD